MKRNAGLAGLIAVAVTGTVLAAPVTVADSLRPSPSEDLAFALDAHGAQIYTCAAGPDGAYKWSFVAPEATLLEKGEIVGTHGAGPTWVSTSDHSSAKGTVRERQDGGEGNIPWLLLTAVSQGSGRFAGVTSVQRVETRGGVEPAKPCNASFAGREARVKYSAVYNFYRKRATY